MAKSDAWLIAIGGGEFAEAIDVVDEFLTLLKKKRDPRLLILTAATNKPEGAIAKYNSLFRGRGIKHVESVDVSERQDAFSAVSLKKISRADALYFTGGDQLNVTTLLSGSPLHNKIRDKLNEGDFMVAGISAGAAMMSKWMIIDGLSNSAPEVGGVEIAPGMDLVDGMIIDTHFSERGRYGRLLTAVAHYAQALGIGIDERTAIFIKNGEFRVVGEGAVTVIDGSPMVHNNCLTKNAASRSVYAAQ